MNKLELLETRKNLLSQASNIVNRCKNEKRELLKVEDNEFQKLINKISKIDDEINDNKQEKNSNTNMKSFLRFLKNSDNEMYELNINKKVVQISLEFFDTDKN